MAVAQAIRPGRPSTRSTRSTRGTNTIPKDITKKTARDKRERRVSPSVRVTQEMREPGKHKSRRTVSTRNRPVDESVGLGTRTRASTRIKTTRSGNKPAKKMQSVKERNNLLGKWIKQPEREPKTTEEAPSDPLPTRTQVYGQRREIKRSLVPVQFVAVMFFVVVVSIFAFGLLRGDPAAHQHTKTDDPEVVETSTNTGILRGQ